MAFFNNPYLSYMILKISAILDLLFPQKCVACGMEGDFLCKRCFKSIKRVDERISVSFLDGVFAIYRYEKGGALQKAVKAMKYRFIKGVACCFWVDLECCLGRNFSREYVLVAVPLHPKREKWRGFNQAYELARGVKWALGNFLVRKKHTQAQADLARSERLTNLSGAFCVKGDVRGKKIILIDDVITTGSTLSECARALREAGAREVWGVVLGHG